MIILSNNHLRWNVVLIFGLGLIGLNVLASLKRQGGFSVCELPYTWRQKIVRESDAEIIIKHLLCQIRKFQKSGYVASDGQISFLWSAGSGGFGMTEIEAASEMLIFQEVVALAEKVQNLLPDTRHTFHMLSSAGGLFEGQCGVNLHTNPNPVRPYGLLKLKQEHYLSKKNVDIVKAIYRPSSVYGFAGAGRRLGLIPTLMQNSFKYRVSNIYGEMHTLRDYVLASDIGRFISKNILIRSACSQTYMLVAGKPSPIFEIVRKIEMVVGRKLYVCYDTGNKNSAHNSYHPDILFESWMPTDIETGIRQTYVALMGRV